jgi:hypothetical protein
MMELLKKVRKRKMTLWFENSYGQEREIAQVNTWQGVYREIDKFITECNERNRADGAKEFKTYYTRIWQQEDGRWRIDVGSHSEFFITDVPYNVVGDDS